MSTALPVGLRALSLRELEEMMAKRGISLDHWTIHRWVLHNAPRLPEAFHARKRRVMGKWYMDATYIKVRGQWTYLYRAIDKSGATVEFLFSLTRTLKDAKRFFRQDQRRITRRIRPMFGFNSPASAAIIRGGNELIHMTRKNQMLPANDARNRSLADQFNSLAA